VAAAYGSDSFAPAAPRLAAVGLSLARAGSAEPILERVDFSLSPGECVLLEGPTGSGKSTLLRACAGLGGVERRAGAIATTGSVGLLLQHVETQLLCPTVHEEVGIGLRDLPLTAAAKTLRIRSALHDVDLAGSEQRETDSLSCGQKQRVVLAALLAREPQTLLLDEPLSALDASTRCALAKVITRLKEGGTALLIAEHAPRELLAVADRCLHIESGSVRARPIPSRRTIPTPDAIADPLPPQRLDDLRPHERVLVTGPNGSGKSFHLRELARQRSPRGHVALVIQHPRRSLFGRTVAEEVAFTIDRLGHPRADRDPLIAELLDRFALLPSVKRSPRRLSFGQQHRLAIAAALAAAPAFILLDEPFAGLDTDARRELLRVLEEEQSRTGAAIVVTSHDREPLESWCTRVSQLPARGFEDV